MILVRSVRKEDFRHVLALAKHLNSYNLPAHAPSLRDLIKDSIASFGGKTGRSQRARYLFVAEDLRTGRVVGSSLIIGRHGSPAMPHLSFQLSSENRTSRFLSRRVEHTTLKLHSDTSGYTEMGGLVVLPRYQGHREKIGRQLSYARFAYVAAHPARFQKKLLVEYLPALDPKKGNRLWELLGQKFTGLSYGEADRLSARSKEFILSLFPKEKIYTCLLPDGVVRNLGTPGPGAQKSVGMLQKIGFRFLRQVDPFDGGPHFGALTGNVSLVRQTSRVVWRGEAFKNTKQTPAMILCEKKGEVRACVLPPGATIRPFKLKEGDPLWVTPF